MNKLKVGAGRSWSCTLLDSQPAPVKEMLQYKEDPKLHEELLGLIQQLSYVPGMRTKGGCALKTPFPH